MNGSRARRSLIAGAAVGGALAGLSSVASMTAATVFARKLVTPERDKPVDATVLAVHHDRHGRPTTAVFAPTVESEAPGRYGLFWDDEAGHARIGEIIGHTDDGGVIRAVDGLTRGDLVPGPARWSGYYVDGSPQDAYGIPTEEISLETQNGPAPTWVTRSGDGRRWAVLVHGRGARRGETLRAVPVLDRLGISTVIPSYRNDPDGPTSLDGRYALGLTEWNDVEAAVAHAVHEGAEEVELLGWSMGGAIVMQFLARSRWADVVGRVFLDGPVLDWADVMAHQARLNKVHPVLATLAGVLLANHRSSRLAGVAQAVDVKLTDWVARSDEITKPTLVVHSVDDDFVPYGPSAELARLRPDLVRWERWDVAHHVREWNVDPQRWERVLAEFMTDELG